LGKKKREEILEGEEKTWGKMGWDFLFISRKEPARGHKKTQGERREERSRKTSEEGGPQSEKLGRQRVKRKRKKKKSEKNSFGKKARR